MPITRRSLLGLVAAGALAPRPVWGAKSTGRRNLLFIFAPGGWDPTYAFAPLFDNPHVSMPDDAEPASIGGFDVVDSEGRPSVRAFFETWGSRTALLHGVSIPSVAHDVCRRIMMTGSNQATREDWGTLVASTGADTLSMPMVHLSGPLYAQEHAGSVIRVGAAGQLAALLDGRALQDADGAVVAPSDAVQALQLAFVRRRTEQAVAAAGPGWSETMANAHMLGVERLEEMLALQGELDLTAGNTLAGAGRVFGACFEAGLSRCAMVAYAGLGWDTHSENFKQSSNFEELFSNVNLILEDLASRAVPGGSLLDETTVVMLSEMGRHPELNSTQGKDHWPWTSALLIGGGVRGGQTIGGWTDGVLGEPVDLASGGISSGGTTLGSQHIGATLMALSDVDPAEFLDDAEPIGAVIA